MRKYLTLLLTSFLASCSALQTTSTTPQPQDLNVQSGSILFQDDFSQPTTGWDRFSAPEGIMDYDGGGYRLFVNAADTNFWSTPGQNYADIRMEVDAGKLGGPDENRIGLVCRFNGGDYYFFMITSDGMYGVGIYTGGEAVLLGQGEMISSESIKPGMAVNHLRADCLGNQLAFYVNGDLLTTVEDPTLAVGDVGLLAGTFSQTGVDVIFDNFVAIKP